VRLGVGRDTDIEQVDRARTLIGLAPQLPADGRALAVHLAVESASMCGRGAVVATIFAALA
jgi:hypothetical protein